jgi:hypothetical protein
MEASSASAATTVGLYELPLSGVVAIVTATLALWSVAWVIRYLIRSINQGDGQNE